MLTAGLSTIKLADFGLGKTLETGSEYVEDTKLIGAAVYMAPEFFKNRNPTYRKDVDIWALGCVIYELIHFKRLFPGSFYPVQMNNVCNNIREPFENYCPDELVKLVNDCTKKIPRERLTISEVVGKITQIRDSIDDSIG